MLYINLLQMGGFESGSVTSCTTPTRAGFVRALPLFMKIQWFISIALLVSAASFAESGNEENLDLATADLGEIDRKLNNPLTSIWSLTFQNNTSAKTGEKVRSSAFRRPSPALPFAEPPKGGTTYVFQTPRGNPVFHYQTRRLRNRVESPPANHPRHQQSHEKMNASPVRVGRCVLTPPRTAEDSRPYRRCPGVVIPAFRLAVSASPGCSAGVSLISMA